MEVRLFFTFVDFLFRKVLKTFFVTLYGDMVTMKVKMKVMMILMMMMMMVMKIKMMIMMIMMMR